MQGRYDLYLEAAHNMDRFVRMLWETVQAIPQYRDKTTFLISADHGRGSGPASWKDHGEKVEASEGIWLAVIGPDTPRLGERFQTAPITQTQIAGDDCGSARTRLRGRSSKSRPADCRCARRAPMSRAARR